MYRRRSIGRGGLGLGRLAIAAVLVVISLFSYFSSRADNPVTGETQYVNISVQDEVVLGLEAAPEMARQYGGPSTDRAATQTVERIGEQIVQNSAARGSPYDYQFHLLGDPDTINAFALPGGQIFITEGLYYQLRSEGELAGVLGHEIGHVVGRHSAEQIAKQQLTQGLTGAAVIAAYDPNNPSSSQAAQMAILVGQLVNLKFGRADELESDWLGVCFINQAGYDPHELIGVMEVLEAASQGQQRPPEFFSTHPNPESRVQRIQEAINNIDQCPR